MKYRAQAFVLIERTDRIATSREGISHRKSRRFFGKIDQPGFGVLEKHARTRLYERRSESLSEIRIRG